MFALLRSEPAAIELFDSLGEREHLKYKLLEVFEELRDNIAISARLQRSSNDVARQLRRIYFLRNRIAHTGHHRGVRPQLATHLFDYIAICYKAIVDGVAAANEGAEYSIGDLLLSSRMGADVVSAAVKPDKPSVSKLSEIVISPVV